MRKVELIHTAYYPSPIGLIKATADANGVASIEFYKGKIEEIYGESDFLIPVIKQLDEYFKGRRKKFDLKINPKGTDFQKKVWNELLKIPFAETISYLDLAKSIGEEKSARAVGLANGKNKLAIVIPCHRVIGKNGNLVGYAAGVDRKRWLLEHELRYSGQEVQLKLFK